MSERHGAGKPKLAITGASGQLGRRAAELVLERCEPGELILVTRSPEKCADFAQRGVDVRFGDFSKPESLHAAFAGAGRLLLISATDLSVREQQHRAAIAAAVAAGVAQIVYTSGLASEPGNPAAVAPSHHATEWALGQSGAVYTILRNSLYAEYQVPEAQRAIETGKLVHNRGNGVVAYVSREDCARAAAAVLVSGGHERAIYDITGPEPFNAEDLAGLYSELGGTAVEPVDVDDGTFIAGMIAGAKDDAHMRYGAELVASFGRSIREGYMSSTTNAVETITGHPPRRLRDVLEPIVRRQRG